MYRDLYRYWCSVFVGVSSANLADDLSMLQLDGHVTTGGLSICGHAGNFLLMRSQQFSGRVKVSESEFYEHEICFRVHTGCWMFLVQYWRILVSQCHVAHWIFARLPSRVQRRHHARDCCDDCRASVCGYGKRCSFAFRGSGARILLAEVWPVRRPSLMVGGKTSVEESPVAVQGTAPLARSKSSSYMFYYIF